MNSLAVFAFKSEDKAVFTKNIREAVTHPRVGAVLCVGYEKNRCYNGIQVAISELARQRRKALDSGDTGFMGGYTLRFCCRVLGYVLPSEANWTFLQERSGLS